MKILFFLLGTLSVSLAACNTATCRGPGGRDPLLETFDADADGRLSAEEIENAATVLRKFDQNGDGNLTRNELPRPPRPEDRQTAGVPREAGSNRNTSSGKGPMKTAADGSVVFEGGFTTDRRDGRRPVALIAAALGVKEQVFRDAFSGVTPSRSGPPTHTRAQANKRILMDALSPHGITNDRLDEVSNYYRYRPQDGQLWKHRAATAKVVWKDKKVVGLTVVDGGAGYMLPPQVSVAGQPGLRVKAKIEFTKDLATNGRLIALEIVQ